MNVIPLRPPDPALLTLLRELLHQAEAGELVSLTYSAEAVGGHVQNGYTNAQNSYEQIGQLERMKALLLRRIEDTARELDLSE